MDFLKGKKTIIGSIAGAVLMVAWSLGLIDDATAKMLLGIVAAWTGVSLRLAIREAASPRAIGLVRDREGADEPGYRGGNGQS